MTSASCLDRSKKAQPPPKHSNDVLPSLYIPKSSWESTAADRQIKKPVKLPEDFDGKQPFKEYLMQFQRCAIDNDTFLTTS